MPLSKKYSTFSPKWAWINKRNNHVNSSYR
ncbi:hypothetical protein KEN51_CDS0285 [Pseudomonas phage vB_Pae10145-KEN51]